jgi:hypothetical protein
MGESRRVTDDGVGEFKIEQIVSVGSYLGCDRIIMIQSE